MESGDIRMRFGRCPYCRAMIYQDPDAVIYYCSKCRTPIRGKNPEATEEMDHALSRLEILSADTASVFSNDLAACPDQASVPEAHADQPPLFRNSKSCSNSTTNIRDNNARFYSNNGQDERRPLSRRTRRPPCSSDSIVLRYGVFTPTHLETEEGSPSPRSTCGRQRRRSVVGLPYLETSIGWSRPAAPPGVARSPLANPAFRKDLLHSLDSLRGLIAGIEPAAAERRSARFFRRLESQLSPALPGHEHSRRRNTGSSRSSSSSAGGRGERRRHHHCRPVFGGAPFVVCGGCSELLQVPATTTLLARRKVVRFRCGGCEEVLRLEAPAGGVGSVPYRTTSTSSALADSDDAGSCNRRECGGGGAQPLPLHRALGYSSPSPLLQSRRY